MLIFRFVFLFFYDLGLVNYFFNIFFNISVHSFALVRNREDIFIVLVFRVETDR